MSNISTVKQRMYQAYSVVSLAEMALKRIIQVTSSFDDSNANMVSNTIADNSKIIDDLLQVLKRMYEVNSVELHLFFRELNRETNNAIGNFNALKSSLITMQHNSITLYYCYVLSTTHYFTYNYPKSMITRYLPFVRTYASKLQVLKQMIDNNNSKLIAGGRE